MPNDLPASSLDAERYLLGVLLRDQLPLPEGLRPYHFFQPAHEQIADAIDSVVSDNHLPDELTVFQKLTEWKSNITAHYLADLTTTVGFSLLNKGWLDAIKRTAYIRALCSTLTKAEELLRQPEADALAINRFVTENFKNHSDEFLPQKKEALSAELMNLNDLDSFDRKNDPNNVLGNRWLCKGGSLLIVGQSGTGKSSLMMQASLHWAIGRDFFGINPIRPLRTIILQAENDLGDVGECFQDIKAGAMFHEQDNRLLEENLHIYRDTICTGKAFARLMRNLIIRHSADIFFCDPLLSFAGIDVSDQEQVSNFLRHDIAPILLETGCILVAMHHTGKPAKASDKEGQTVADLAYSGLGSSEFTNYFREVAVLMRCQGENPVYKFGLTKRRGRSNLKDIDGRFAPEILIRHARQQGVIKWEYSTSDSDSTSQTPPKSNANTPRRH